MKKLLIFLAGFVVGALFLFIILYVIRIRSDYSEREMFRKKIISELMNTLDNKVQEVQTQYVEVKGKKGNVTLYTGMPKDSVKILVGKPDEINLFSMGDIPYENWGYKLKNSYISDLKIEFKNGKLEEVRQN